MENKKINYLLTERPVDMSYETYKAIKNHQTKMMKQYKIGKYVTLANKKSK